MNTLVLSRALGWFSLGLGAIEILFPARLARRLGLPNGNWLVRAFGMREVAAGLMILGEPDAIGGPVSRVAGDALDLAMLLPALSPRNPHRQAANVAFLTVVAATAIDLLCVAAMSADERKRRSIAERARI